jgi:hypothetical protein
MNRLTEILKRYEQADSEMRLYLYLQYPDLRDAFNDMELTNPAVDNSRITSEWAKYVKL